LEGVQREDIWAVLAGSRIKCGRHTIEFRKAEVWARRVVEIDAYLSLEMEAENHQRSGAW